VGSTLTFIAMVVLWEVLVVQLRIPGWTLPSPSAIAEAMIDLRSELFGHFMVTLYESLVEFALAIIISIPLAVAVVYSPILQNTIYPILRWLGKRAWISHFGVDVAVPQPACVRSARLVDRDEYPALLRHRIHGAHCRAMGAKKLSERLNGSQVGLVFYPLSLLSEE
jgi:hypothetical protein